MSKKGNEKIPNNARLRQPVSCAVVIIALAAFTAFFTGCNSRIDALEKRLQRAEDVQAIERLQYAYNYYVSRLEKFQVKSGLGETEFFLHLLRTPLAQRESETIRLLQAAGYTERGAKVVVGRMRSYLK